MNEFVSSSPQQSEAISEENDVSSNKETSLLGQTHCPSNSFKAAYVTVTNQQRPVQCRKTFAFWTLVILLFLLAVGNLVLTMTILGVLRLGNGMQSIELLPEDKSIKLFGDVDLDRIYKQNGVVEGFEGENMDITAEDSSLLINLYSRFNRVFNKVKIDKNHTCFNGFSSFDIKTKRKESVFDVINPTYNNLKNVNTFKAKSIATNKIRSKLDENLKIEGDTLHMKGNEGSKIEGKVFLSYFIQSGP